MGVYIIAQLKFKNMTSYRRYQTGFPAVFAKYNGEAIVADENPQCLEGEWLFNKVVILYFPNTQEALKFQQSPEYQHIAKDRKRGADSTIIIAQGRALELKGNDI